MATISISSSPSTTAQTRRWQHYIHPWIDFFLLAFMLTNLAWSIRAANWSPGLDRLFPVVIVAAIAGTIIALSNFSRSFSYLYSLIIGAAVILWSMSALAPDELLGQERVLYIINRTLAWTSAAISDEPFADTMVFVLVLSVLLWVLAFGATWAYFREEQKWQAIVPAGLAMLINLYYAPPNLNVYFVIFLLCAILLLVRATLAERQSEWIDARVHFPFDISFDFMRDGILFAIFVIFVSWILPAAASDSQLSPFLRPLQEPWRQVQQEWQRLFSTMNYSRAPAGTSFGTSLTLGGPRNVNDDIVMDVETPVDRYYRAVIMDTYLRGGWILQNAEGVRLGEENDFSLPTWSNRREITQTVTVYQPGNVILAAPQPVDALLPVDARIVRIETGSANGVSAGNSNQAELAMLVSRKPLAEGDTYVVVSSIVDATEAQLRADSTNYPQDIKDRYLQLPDTISQRVFDLADEVTAGMDNPYEIAKRLEGFLRTYEYNDQIPGPAPGQDGVDYFLFEEKQGYCNYYASSLAVMLRYLGIPTRIAVGYATGEYLPDADAYRLRNKDSHTWVEVYFPTYGWVEFEPTASEPALARPPGEQAGEDGSGSPGSTGDNLFNFNEDRNFQLPEDEIPATGLGPQTPASWLEGKAGILLLVGSILGILLIAIWSARRMQGPKQGHKKPVFHSVPDGFSTRLWDKLMRWARRLKLTQNPSLTPFEQASGLARIVPEAAPGINAIAELYTRDLYSPYDITTEEASEAQLSWLNLRPVLWRYWLDQRLRLPAGLKRSLFMKNE